jgi:hypothetical protein
MSQQAKPRFTPGPWAAHAGAMGNTSAIWGVRNDDSECVAVTKDTNNQTANAQRIVDCVNACEGINPKAVPAMREALICAEDALHAAMLAGNLPPTHYDLVIKPLRAALKLAGEGEG